MEIAAERLFQKQSSAITSAADEERGLFAHAPVFGCMAQQRGRDSPGLRMREGRGPRTRFVADSHVRILNSIFCVRFCSNAPQQWRNAPASMCNLDYAVTRSVSRHSRCVITDAFRQRLRCHGLKAQLVSELPKRRKKPDGCAYTGKTSRQRRRPPSVQLHGSESRCIRKMRRLA